MSHTYNSSAWEVEEKGSLEVQGQPGILGELKISIKLHNETTFQKKNFFF